MHTHRCNTETRGVGAATSVAHLRVPTLRRLLLPLLLLPLLLLALLGAVTGTASAAGDWDVSASTEPGITAADCAAAGGTYFGSIEGVEGGEHFYGCLHDDSVTICDDRMPGGNCTNYGNDTMKPAAGTAGPRGVPQDPLEAVEAAPANAVAPTGRVIQSVDDAENDAP